MKKIVVYCLAPEEINHDTTEYKNIEIEKWSPTLLNWIPPNSSIIYILFWVAHHFRIFKNRSYCAYKIVKDNQPISSLICVPPLFIWSFMKANDIQIKNVFTHPDYRGKRLAHNLLEAVKKLCYEDNRTFWYMTHDKNHSSLRLCEKAGFSFKGYYQKKVLFSF